MEIKKEEEEEEETYIDHDDNHSYLFRFFLDTCVRRIDQSHLITTLHQEEEDEGNSIIIAIIQE